MPWDPNRVPDEGDISPQTLVFNYLKSKGLPLNADNVRRTIEANAREPGILDTMRGTQGPDPVAGLRNAPTEDNVGSVGKGGNVASRIEGGGRRGGSSTPVDASNPARTDSERAATDGSGAGGGKQTSAAPGDDEDAYAGLSLPGALGSAILGGGLYGLSRLRGRGGPADVKPTLGGYNAEGVDTLQSRPAYTAEGSDPLQSRARAYDPIHDPGFTMVGEPYGPAGQPSLMESSMQKALALPGPEVPLQLGGPSGVPQLSGPSGMPQVGGPANVPQLPAPQSNAIPMPGPQAAPAQPLALPAPEPALPGVQPYQPMTPGVQPVPPSAVSGMATGPSTVDPSVLNEANIRGNLVPPPQIPLRPRVPSSIIPPEIQELIRGGLRGAAPVLRGLTPR